MSRVAVPLLVGIVLGCASCSRDTGPDIDALMSDYFIAIGPSSRAAAIDAIVEANIDPSVVAERLRAGRTYEPVEQTGWQVYTLDCLDGASRPFQVYIPPGYDPNRRHPLIVYLHGAVNRGYNVEELSGSRRIWQESADERGHLLLIPHGDRHATWWSANGLAMIHSQLDFLKARYNVDENRVFVSGFSDGASGAYWMAFHDPTPWAGFLAWHGNPSVPSMGPYSCYPRNLLNRPIRATNGRTDELYPAEAIGRYIDQFRDASIEFEWEMYDTGHDFSFFEMEKPRSLQFIDETTRNPARHTVIWETATADVGRCDWIRIDEIADVGANHAFTDVNLLYLENVLHIGATVQCLKGVCTVTRVARGSIAEGVGIQPGDQLLTIRGQALSSQADVDRSLDGLTSGDPVSITIERGGTRYGVNALVPPPIVLYPRYDLTGSIRAEVTDQRIDISLQHVARFTLFLSSAMIDLSHPIEIIINGETTFTGRVEPDLRFMLEQAALDLDREAVYEARMEIDVGTQP